MLSVGSGSAGRIASVQLVGLVVQCYSYCPFVRLGYHVSRVRGGIVCAGGVRNVSLVDHGFSVGISCLRSSCGAAVEGDSGGLFWAGGAAIWDSRC